jgi:hypothetical protein
MNATTTKLLSSGEFCKLRYEAIPVKSAPANVSFYEACPESRDTNVLNMYNIFN